MICTCVRVCVSSHIKDSICVCVPPGSVHLIECTYVRTYIPTYMYVLYVICMQVLLLFHLPRVFYIHQLLVFYPFYRNVRGDLY